MESINEIKQLFEQKSREQWKELFLQYETDSRAGVQKLVTRYKKKIVAYEKEMHRFG